MTETMTEMELPGFEQYLGYSSVVNSLTFYNRTEI